MRSGDRLLLSAVQRRRTNYRDVMRHSLACARVPTKNDGVCVVCLRGDGEMRVLLWAAAAVLARFMVVSFAVWKCELG